MNHEFPIRVSQFRDHLFPNFGGGSLNPSSVLPKFEFIAIKNQFVNFLTPSYDPGSFVTKPTSPVNQTSK